MPKDIDRDPALLARVVPTKFAGEVRVLGLDLGTTCGAVYAHHRPGEPADPAAVGRAMVLGQWDLSAGPYDSGALRFVRLRQFLHVLAPDAVFFEDVRYTPAEKVTRYNAAQIVARAATSCELFGAFKATVAAWCEAAGVPCGSFPIGVIKRRATARGNANKEQVIAAANAAFGCALDPVGYEATGVDNVADAAWVCLLGVEQYGGGMAARPARRERKRKTHASSDRLPDG